MRSASRDQLREAEWRLYDFVTRHFLATVSVALSSHEHTSQQYQLTGEHLLHELCLYILDVNLARQKLESLSCQLEQQGVAGLSGKQQREAQSCREPQNHLRTD